MATIGNVWPLTIDDPDQVFAQIRFEAEEALRREPEVGGLLASSVLNHATLEQAVGRRLSARLSHPDLSGDVIERNFLDLTARDASLGEGVRADLLAVAYRDPACHRLIEPLLYFKGFQALQTHRLAHALWNAGRKDFALYLQSRSSAVFQTDINPAARIGKGVFLDHATGLVVGATAVIEDDVSILHSVTLGGTGLETGDRHPKIRRGVLIGAGAKIIGNIEIGQCSRIAAGSVVLKTVPAHVTVAGVPARIVGASGCAEPAREMDQILVVKNGDERFPDTPG
ncbi:serine O-acetyltransferase [uncultured Rhodoblastus sp.]|uniref:serine O-acetyltransferase n=1 Tax=uncultured Rhodoblastus sp. TaxID=543037 RepID=UPI0025D477B2|nr:serine O-acetyltransferase [uncultured Rhodoblastus sp.]